MDKTTPRPWAVNGSSRFIYAPNSLNREIVCVRDEIRNEEDAANLELIAHAVKSYDANQSALKALAWALENLHGSVKHDACKFCDALRLAQEVLK